jgi:hypothetical protein
VDPRIREGMSGDKCMEAQGSILCQVTNVVEVLGAVSLLPKLILGYKLGIGHNCFITHLCITTVIHATAERCMAFDFGKDSCLV